MALNSTKLIEDTYESIRNGLITEDEDRPKVYHVAEVDGWKMKLFTTDHGATIYATCIADGKIIGFKRISQHSWAPITTSSQRSDLVFISELFKKAKWEDADTRRINN